MNNLQVFIQAIRVSFDRRGGALVRRRITPVMYLTARDVCDIFGVSYPTVWRMIAAEHLRATRIFPGGQYKIPASEVLRYAEEHNIPLTESHRQLLEEINIQSDGLKINRESSKVEASA